MASIMTNASALTALQSLATTNKSLEMTQARISTGYRVATASDNAAYWSIATTMRSDKSSLSVVQDALGLGAGKVITYDREEFDPMTKTLTKGRDVLRIEGDDKEVLEFHKLMPDGKYFKMMEIVYTRKK